MRYFLLLLALVGCSTTAFAQTPVPAGPTAAAQLAVSAPDTAAAIHRLFAAKRKRQVIITVATLGAAVGAGAVVLSSNQQTGGGGGGGYGILTSSGPLLDNRATGVLAIGVLMLPVALVEAVLFGGWSEKQEQQTLTGWQQRTESRFLKRRLKPKYFGPPPAASLYP